MANNPGPEYELNPDELHLVKLDCHFDEERACMFKEGMAELPSKTELVTLLFVPRDGRSLTRCIPWSTTRKASALARHPGKILSVWGSMSEIPLWVPC